ncbi:MAG: hypothetical protein IJ400_04590 [Clostridia bacterium]|nr:hypothetical protein [Clostridia bacterium]
MRKLTIKRTKSFVACLGKAKVYIEDESSSELTIASVPVRKLGTLKNGEEVSFEVEEGALRVFVIFDTMSKEYCNDIYELPAEGDVYLTGKCGFNPGVGNAFRFDNNETQDSLKNRKKGAVIGWIVLGVSVVVGFIIGWYIAFLI